MFKLACHTDPTFGILAIVNALTWAGVMIAVAVVLKGTPQSETVKSILLIGWLIGQSLLGATCIKPRSKAPLDAGAPPVR